jgi:protein SCO1
MPGLYAGAAGARYLHKGREIAVVNWGVTRRLFPFLMMVLTLVGCQGSHNLRTNVNVKAANRTYGLRGKVIATNAARGEVTLSHDAIPGFMDAMTMPYKLKDPSILGELHPGDVITADVLVAQGADESVQLDHIVVVAQGQPDYKPMVEYHVPTAGDVVPDFVLRNQDGRMIRLDEYRGKVLLITFIYTRCPLPDFCPRVTRNFATIERQLAANAAVLAKTQLLSVSFDPEHDTPERLRAFGAQYIGSDAKDVFAHWDFAVPRKPVLLEMAKYFDVGITPGPDETITHTLSTTLIGRDGKVVRFYPGNEWTPEQVAADVERAVSGE